MKVVLLTLCCALVSSLGMATLALCCAEPQVFSTSAGPVKITPLNHASTLIEAGGKTIYLDPAKPVKFSGLPKADLILITDIHGDHMDPDCDQGCEQVRHRDFRCAGGGADCDHSEADRQW